MTDTDRMAQMAREADLIEKARQAGFEYNVEAGFTVRGNFAQLQAFARLVAEDCAKVCDDKASKVYDHAKAPYLNMSQAIRARYK